MITVQCVDSQKFPDQQLKTFTAIILYEEHTDILHKVDHHITKGVLPAWLAKHAKKSRP